MIKKGIVLILALCLLTGIIPAFAEENALQKANREAIEELSKRDGYKAINASELEALLSLQKPFVLVYYSSGCGMWLGTVPMTLHFLDQYDMEIYFFDNQPEGTPARFWSVFKDDADPGFGYPLVMTYDGSTVQSVDLLLFNGKSKIDQYRLIARYLNTTQNVDMITDFEIYNNTVRKQEREDTLALAAYLTQTDRFPAADPKVVNFANDLTKGLSTDEEKAKKIFLWTSSKIMNFVSTIQATYKANPDFKAPTDDTAVDVIDNTIFGEYYYPHHLMVALLRSVGIPTKWVDYDVVNDAHFYELFKHQAEYLNHKNKDLLFEQVKNTYIGIYSERVIISSFIDGKWVMMSPDTDVNSLQKAGENLPVKAATLEGYDLKLPMLSQQHVFHEFEDELSLEAFEAKYRETFEKLGMNRPIESYVHVKVKGEHLTFSDAWPFIDENGKTQVPVTSVLKAYGATVKWHGGRKEVEVKKGNDTVIIPVDQKVIYKNGVAIAIETSARIIGGRTFLPIASVIQALDGRISWDSKNRTVLIE